MQQIPSMLNDAIFQLVFRVLESHGDYGLIMIDNITITSGLCGKYIYMQLSMSQKY